VARLVALLEELRAAAAPVFAAALADMAIDESADAEFVRLESDAVGPSFFSVSVSLSLSP
jgi:hypothetical protein